MPYGQIFRNLTAAGGAIAHTMGTANFCVFMIQDITGPGALAPQALPRFFCPDANKNSATFTAVDNTVAAPCSYDALVVTPHSLIDVGPIVNGNTRGGTALYNPTYTGPAASNPYSEFGYRSLHYNVSFTLTGPAVTVDVVVTHRLNNTNTVAIVSPSADTCDAGAAGVLVKVWQSATTANTTTLTMAMDTGIAPIAPTTVTFDVMILVRTIVEGSFLTSRAHTIGGVAGAAYSDDYSGADVARQVTGQVASYSALYTNVDGLAAAGTAVTHNMGSSTGAMALIGRVSTSGKYVALITDTATTIDTMTFATLGGIMGMNDNVIYFCRPYSMLIQ